MISRVRGGCTCSSGGLQVLCPNGCVRVHLLPIGQSKAKESWLVNRKENDIVKQEEKKN
jgi:hypothetical protein